MEKLINPIQVAELLGMLKVLVYEACKKRTMLTLEGRVNEMALGSDTEGLKRALSEYQGLILDMVKEYKALKEKKGQEMLNFGVK